MNFGKPFGWKSFGNGWVNIQDERSFVYLHLKPRPYRVNRMCACICGKSYLANVEMCWRNQVQRHWIPARPPEIKFTLNSLKVISLFFVVGELMIWLKRNTSYVSKQSFDLKRVYWKVSFNQHLVEILLKRWRHPTGECLFDTQLNLQKKELYDPNLLSQIL